MSSFSCRGLTIRYPNNNLQTEALSAVTVDLKRAHITAVIGESGSGKTTLARFFSGTLPDTAEVSIIEARVPRSASIVEQEAEQCLHPLLTVGTQLQDCLERTRYNNKRKRKKRVYELLEEVELEPLHYYRRYPHQLSGGEAQRIAVARALAFGSEMLVADEPTAHVDLIVQAKILKFIVHTVKKHSLACLFVTHDLSIAEEIASSIAVLYRGEIVEQGTPSTILEEAHHPYTRALVRSAFRVGLENSNSSVPAQDQSETGRSRP